MTLVVQFHLFNKYIKFNYLLITFMFSALYGKPKWNQTFNVNFNKARSYVCHFSYAVHVNPHFHELGFETHFHLPPDPPADVAPFQLRVYQHPSPSKAAT